MMTGLSTADSKERELNNQNEKIKIGLLFINKQNDVDRCVKNSLRSFLLNLRISNKEKK